MAAVRVLSEDLYASEKGKRDPSEKRKLPSEQLGEVSSQQRNTSQGSGG